MRRQMTPDELDDLFRCIGRNIWHIQYLEDVLHIFLTMKIEIGAPGRITEKEAQILLAKHRRATLGTALRTAERNKALPECIMARLRILKEERDWLVHRSMNQEGDALYTAEGRNTVFTRLEEILDMTLSAKEQILVECQAFCSSHGIDAEATERIARLQIAKLKGEA